MNAGPDIRTHVTDDSGKLILSCNMTGSHSHIKGHKWVHGDKVLQTDTDSNTFTSYM